MIGMRLAAEIYERLLMIIFITDKFT